MAGGQPVLTTGQLAKRTGVTVRTLRYYDRIGLLPPAEGRPGGARLYGMEALRRLQQIRTLKFVGLSLEEIRELLSADGLTDLDLKSSLQAQIDVLRGKLTDTERVLRAVREAMAPDPFAGEAAGAASGERAEAFELERLARLIRAVELQREWGEQYRNAARLRSRIHLYDKFSANPYGWHRWVFDRLEAGRDAHILELGCGDGALWARNADRIPPGWRITLTDASSGMVDEARSRLRGVAGRFRFLTVDAQDIPFHEEQFDLVIANNMLYHVLDLPRAVRETHRVLKAGGAMYAATMSLRHLREIERLAWTFDPALRVLDPAVERFHLDNGGEALSAAFRDIRKELYEDRLRIEEAAPLVDYVVSTPMNARERLQGAERDRFRAFVERRLAESGPIEATKENGLFIGRK